MDTEVFSLNIEDLGVVPYSRALDEQEKRLKGILSGKFFSSVLFLEHSPVLTMGRGAGLDNAFDLEYFRKCDIPVVKADRGGGLTLHMPGQLVVYPLIDLEHYCRKDIVYYLDTLEMIISRALLRLGIQCENNNKKRGVWARGAKIGFIGVAFKQWVSYHGFSVNINNDNRHFQNFNVCGEKGIKVTSAKDMLMTALDMDLVKKVFAEVFCDVFFHRYPVKEGKFRGNSVIGSR